jgi:hypothetical protein
LRISRAEFCAIHAEIGKNCHTIVRSTRELFSSAGVYLVGGAIPEPLEEISMNNPNNPNQNPGQQPGNRPGQQQGGGQKPDQQHQGGQKPNQQQQGGQKPDQQHQGGQQKPGQGGQSR